MTGCITFRIYSQTLSQPGNLHLELRAKEVRPSQGSVTPCWFQSILRERIHGGKGLTSSAVAHCAGVPSWPGQQQHLGRGSSVQFSCSVMSDSATPWTAPRQASLSINNSRSLLKLMSIASVMPSNHLILCHPLILLPSVFPSIRVFSNKSVLRIRWPKYWSFSLSISPSNEYSGLISLRTDWFDLLAVQGTLRVLS